MFARAGRARQRPWPRQVGHRFTQPASVRQVEWGSYEMSPEWQNEMLPLRTVAFLRWRRGSGPLVAAARDTGRLSAEQRAPSASRVVSTQWISEARYTMRALNLY